MHGLLTVAAASFLLPSAPLPRSPSSSCRAGEPLAIDAPVAGVAVFVGAATAFGLQQSSSSPENVDADARMAGLQSRLDDARSSTATTYREVTPSDVLGEQLDFHVLGEQQQRRARVLARAQEMLDGARETVQQGLDEAIAAKDYESAEEYIGETPESNAKVHAFSSVVSRSSLGSRASQPSSRR